MYETVHMPESKPLYIIINVELSAREIPHLAHLHLNSVKQMQKHATCVMDILENDVLNKM